MRPIDCLARRLNKSVSAKTKSSHFSGALAMAFALAAQIFLGAEANAGFELRWFFDQDPQLINTNFDKDRRVVIVRVISKPYIMSPRMPPPFPSFIKVEFNENITCRNGREIEANVITDIKFELPSDYRVGNPGGPHYEFVSLAAVKIGYEYYAILKCESGRLSFVYIAQ